MSFPYSGVPDCICNGAHFFAVFAENNFLTQGEDIWQRFRVIANDEINSIFPTLPTNTNIYTIVNEL